MPERHIMAPTYEQMLAEKRANTWEQAKALLDHAADEKRELDAAEEASFAKMNEDLRSQGEAIARLVEARKLNDENEAALRKLSETLGSAEHTAKPVENDALRAFLRGETRAIDIKPATGEMRRFTSGNAGAEARSLVKGTTTAGGFTVPTNFYSKLWAHLILTANLMNAGATILTTDNGDSLQIPTTTAHSTGALVAEAAAIGSSDPAFAQRTLSAYKYGVLIQVARELLDDTGVDLEGYLSMQAGRAVGNALGTDLVIGNGTAKPLGITSSTTLGVTGGAGVVGAFTFDNLIDLHYSVIPQYRNTPSAGWLFNDLSVGQVRKLKDTQNRYLWEPSLVAGTPDTILNKPVFTDPNIPVTALSAKSVLFGDLAAYFVRVVNGVRFEQSLDYAFNTDLVTFRCLIRADGVLVDQTGAVKHFAGNAA